MKFKNATVLAATGLVAALTMASPAKILFAGMLKHPNNTHKDQESIQTIRVDVDARTLRKAQIRFDVHKNVAVETSSSFLQGAVTFVGSRKSAYPAAASIIGDRVRITFPGPPTGSRQSRQRTYVVTAPYRPGDSVVVGAVQSVPSSAHSHTACGGEYEEHETSKQVARINEGLPSGMTNVATIHTYADPEFYQVYGAHTNDAILDYVNSTEVFYTRQFGVSFRVVGQTILNSTTETSAGGILASFRDNTSTQNSEVDLKHLFTGKDMDGSTVGIAFVSVLCRDPDYSYGVTQNYLGGAITPYILAHELGHNFGGSHDVTTRSIMYPSIQTFSDVKFSEQSVREIGGYLSEYGSCLSLEQTDPNLRLATLSVGRINRLIYARLKTESGEAFPNQKMVLFINGTARTLITDSSGTVRFVIRSKRRGRFTVVAKTEGEEVYSNTLSFRLR
jgi:hypothetical protein